MLCSDYNNGDYYLEASARRPEGGVEGEHDDEDGRPELILPWGRAGQGGRRGAERPFHAVQTKGAFILTL